jgi:hypothetical protein
MFKTRHRNWLSHLALAFFLWTTLVSRVIYFYYSDDKQLIGVIPDDAFYYLVLAQNRVAYGFWTFDGVAPASGFHLLYAYTLSTIYTLFGAIDWRHLFLAISFVASTLIAFSCYLVLTLVHDKLGKGAILWTLATFFSSFVLWQPTMLMEAWYVIFFAALSIYCVFMSQVSIKKGDQYLALNILILGLVGFGGSLSRSDYGMLPGCIFIASLLVSQRWNQEVIKSTAILAGACIGVGFVLLHNYSVGGSFVQASAQIKLHNSIINGFSFTPSLDMLKGILFPFNGKIPKFVFFGFILLWSLYYVGIALKRIIIFWRDKSDENAADRTVIGLRISCILSLVGYIVLYRLNSHALQIWYVANFIIPASIIFALIGNDIFKLFKVRWVGVVPIVYIAVGLSYTFDTQWPHQASMMNAGLYLNKNREPGNYGAWNAGIVNYFSKIPITNLDGLTNDQIVPYIKSDQFLNYLNTRQINYLIDSEEMLKSQRLRRQGGYDRPATDRCITRLIILDDQNSRFQANTPVGLYAVDLPCIQKME